mgnify:FL=1|tara:strand:+ start:884 stop:1495 length:612 start_codon:yes stop_codon:yes gene_type:complete
MKSLSEIETTSKRASRGVGFSWGIAEEVGKCIRLLELFGLPGIKNLNNYYQKKSKENFDNIKLINQKNTSNKNPLCPISLGICCLDQIRKIENYNECLFKNVAYPLLLLPFLSRSSEIIGKKILVVLDKYEILLNFNTNISSNSLKKEFPTKAKIVKISFLNNKDSFTDYDWKNLYKLSENTFVEESDSLKKGAAGAGLNDND